MTEIIYECCRDCRLLDVCDPNYNGEPPCFQKDMESQTTAVQQLKAEIAAIADTILISVSDFDITENVIAVRKLRQLSAV